MVLSKFNQQSSAFSVVNLHHRDTKDTEKIIAKAKNYE
jgi:hypothetical protein